MRLIFAFTCGFACAYLLPHVAVNGVFVVACWLVAFVMFDHSDDT